MFPQCAPSALLPGTAWSWRTEVELLHGALPGLGGEVGIPHGHLDGRMAHQLLDDLERDTPHGEVATVGVPHPSYSLHVRQYPPPASTPQAREHIQGERPASSPAQSKRGVRCFLGSSTVAAKAGLCSSPGSAPA
jgi:hypothetical protein